MSEDCGCCEGCGAGRRGAEPFVLAQRVEYADQAIVSSTLVDGEAGTLTVFAFDAGQHLSTHSAPYDAIVQVLDGEADITVGGVEHKVGAGQVIIMPADVPHGLRAPGRFKMLLTMFRA
jgi:quercetin dioxygenase-like cupin family protein